MKGSSTECPGNKYSNSDQSDIASYVLTLDMFKLDSTSLHRLYDKCKEENTWNPSIREIPAVEHALTTTPNQHPPGSSCDNHEEKETWNPSTGEIPQIEYASPNQHPPGSPYDNHEEKETFTGEIPQVECASPNQHPPGSPYDNHEEKETFTGEIPQSRVCITKSASTWITI